MWGGCRGPALDRIRARSSDPRPWTGAKRGTPGQHGPRRRPAEAPASAARRPPIGPPDVGTRGPAWWGGPPTGGEPRPGAGRGGRGPRCAGAGEGPARPALGLLVELPAPRRPAAARPGALVAASFSPCGGCAPTLYRVGCRGRPKMGLAWAPSLHITQVIRSYYRYIWVCDAYNPRYMPNGAQSGRPTTGRPWPGAANRPDSRTAPGGERPSPPVGAAQRAAPCGGRRHQSRARARGAGAE